MKVITKGMEARLLIKSGIDLVADAVKLTLGPSGRNAIIGKKYEPAETTNDGITLANAIESENETVQLGVELAREVGKLTDNKAKDGTTTSITLLQSINNEAFKKLQKDSGSLVATKVDPISIKKEILSSCDLVVKELDKMAIQISSKEEMEKVAFVSVEDKKIAKEIATIFDKVGKDGIVRVEDGAEETTYEIIDGMEINSGYSSSIMANTQDKELVVDNIRVLVTNSAVNDIPSLQALMKKIGEKGILNLVIIAEDFSKDVIQSAELTKRLSGQVIYCLRPSFWTNKERMQDVAMRFGAFFFDKDQGLSIDVAEVENLGTIKKVVASKNKTILLGNSGDMSARVDEIKADIKKTKGAVDKLKLEERIANLTGGIAIIKVGANSDSERVYWKAKIIDAVGAVQGALQEGVVKGGGLALKEISEKLPENILTEALKAPYKQIMSNVGFDLEIGDDIIDSVRTTKASLIGACSLAGTVITLEVAVAIKKDKKDESNSN